MHEFAHLIDKEDEYQGRYDSDEWEEKWLQDLMLFINNNFVSYDNSFEAIALLSMREALIEDNINTRKHGYLIQAGTGYIISNYEGEEETPSIDLYAEYAKPFGIRSQFINATQLSILEDSASDYILTNNMSYTYEIDSDIDWENGWNLEYASGENDLTTNTAYTALNFELTNALDLTATYQLSHTEDDVDNNGNDDIEQSLFVGVRYRFR